MQRLDQEQQDDQIAPVEKKGLAIKNFGLALQESKQIEEDSAEPKEFGEAMKESQKAEEFVPDPSLSGRMYNSNFVRNSLGRKKPENPDGSLSSRDRNLISARSSNIKRMDFGVEEESDSGSGSQSENPTTSPFKQYKIDAPGLDDSVHYEDQLDILNTSGLEKQWEQWKGHVNYQLEDEKVDKQQMKECYDEFFQGDENVVEGAANDEDDEDEQPEDQEEKKNVLMDSISLRMDLYNSYVKDFEQCMEKLRQMIDDPSMQKILHKDDPVEFLHAQQYIKSMEQEIEAMNVVQTEVGCEEARSAKEQYLRHNIEFYQISMDLKKAQESYQEQVVVSLSTQRETDIQVETEMDDLERSSNELMTQRASLHDEQHESYSAEDIPNDIKVNSQSKSSKVIQAERKRNRYLLLLLFILAAIGILYVMFTWIIPSFSSTPEGTPLIHQKQSVAKNPHGTNSGGH